MVVRLTAPNFYDPRGALRRADAVIASGTSMETLRASGQVPGVVNVPNAVDTARFRPQASDFRKAHGLAAGDLALIYVARFQAFKNHAVLVDAFARVLRRAPEAVLLLAGSGPLRERVEQQAAALGIAARIRFLGEVPFAELPQVYAAADLGVISSDYESFCFAALECMATALPVATTDCGWVPRLLGGPRAADGLPAGVRALEGGTVSPVGQAEALADAILYLRDRPELRRAIGAFNRAKAEREHGWTSSAARLLELYRSLVPTAGGTG